jgi:type I restriction enzyme S subunit
MVEWKNIGEICYISDYVSNGSFASLRENVQYKNEPDYAILVRVADYSCGFDASKFVYIDEHAYNFLAKSSLDGGEIIMSNVGSCGLLFRCPKLDRKMSLAPNAILIKSDYIDFLYYWLGSNTGQEEIKKITSKSAMPKFNKTEFKKINIPIPSLEEQTRIVGILDTFTSAIDNLKEQIAQRRKQYEYYRDQLLDLEGKPGVEMKPLGEIGEFIRGNGIQKNDFVEVGFSCIHYGQIHARYGFSANKSISKIQESLYKKCKKAQKGDVVLATTSEDAEGVAKPFVWLGNEDAAVSGDAFVFHHNQNGKFMGYQFLTHRFMQFKIKNATGAKVVRISGENMAKYKVALPSLDEQQRIVSILDSFEASIQNLEAQLEQRQKQYEYYRNKLLTFE